MNSNDQDDDDDDDDDNHRDDDDDDDDDDRSLWLKFLRPGPLRFGSHGVRQMEKQQKAEQSTEQQGSQWQRSRTSPQKKWSARFEAAR